MGHQTDGRREPGPTRTGPGLTRRAALLTVAAASLAGCSILDDLLDPSKPKLPGKRDAVMSTRRGLTVEAGYAPRITLPPPVENADWLQPGGTPSHEMGHPALGDTIRQVWTSNIGRGGGYRRKITAQPIIAAGRAFAMDSDGFVTAFDARTGSKAWEFDTQGEDDRSSNVGGGISIAGGTLYAATGRGELIALETAGGKLRWRMPLGTAARAAGTVADGRVYVPTLSDQVVASAADDGHRLWAYQGLNTATSVFGLPAPAFAEGIVVAGFGAGDLAGVRAISGAVVWNDNLASSAGRNSLVDLATIRGLPVIVNGQVYATSIGGLTVAIDLRAGRRLWEREVGSYESLCVAGDWIFIVSVDQELAALSRADGRVAWVTPLPRWENEEKQRDPVVWHGPTLAGDRLLLGGSNKTAIAVSPYTGKILGTQELPDKVSVSPVVAGRTAYFVVDDGSLIAMR